MKSMVLPAVIATVLAPFAAQADEESWTDLRDIIFEGRTIHDGADVIALEAPYRAHDAAVVPITVQSLIPQSDERWIKTLHLIIDENPSPVAGIFHLARELPDASISTRIRVNEYTYVRVIAETSDGELYMQKAFVKAAGGCSAPATKDAEAALARLGKMRMRNAAETPAGFPSVEVAVSHPNYSGLQINQVTRNWIPPDYVNRIEIALDGTALLEVESDISLAEDPAITFSMPPGAAGTLSVAVDDIEGRHFEQSWAVGPSS